MQTLVRSSRVWQITARARRTRATQRHPQKPEERKAKDDDSQCAHTDLEAFKQSREREPTRSKFSGKRRAINRALVTFTLAPFAIAGL